MFDNVSYTVILYDGFQWHLPPWLTLVPKPGVSAQLGLGLERINDLKENIRERERRRKRAI